MVPTLRTCEHLWHMGGAAGESGELTSCRVPPVRRAEEGRLGSLNHKQVVATYHEDDSPHRSLPRSQQVISAAQGDAPGVTGKAGENSQNSKEQRGRLTGQDRRLSGVVTHQAFARGRFPLDLRWGQGNLAPRSLSIGSPPGRTFHKWKRDASVYSFTPA